MAWMSDEEYLLMQDTRDKKVTARSSRHTRTHCGKGGRVKFPSDYLSKKELKAMNGKCETYRMNSPISWDEFKSYPEEHQKTYIQLLRKKWNVPNKYIAEMFGVVPNTLNNWIKCLGLSQGMGNGAKVWDREGFLAWRGGAASAVKPSETSVEEAVEEADDIPVEEEVATRDECMLSLDEAKYVIEEVENGVEGGVSKTCDYSETHCAVPNSGRMTFKGNVHDILRTIGNLFANSNLNLTISWTTEE